MLSVLRHKITIIMTLNSHYCISHVLFSHTSVEMRTDNNLFQCHFLVNFFSLRLLPASQCQHPVSSVMKFETQEVTEIKRSPGYFLTSLYRSSPGGSDDKESACNAWRPGFNPWVRKIPWRRAWQPTAVFLPGESMDRGAWWATVHGVTKNQTRQSNWHFYVRKAKTRKNW